MILHIQSEMYYCWYWAHITANSQKIAALFQRFREALNEHRYNLKIVLLSYYCYFSWLNS